VSVDRNESSASHVIRFMWRDSGRAIPLWDADAVLPADAAWLGTALRLSGDSILELTAWVAARGNLERFGFANEEALSDLDARADDLVTRLAAELPPPYSVEYQR
jgi:hypothetical protein